MKKLLFLLIIAVFMFSGGTCFAEEEIKKSMDISNPNMELSGNCKILNNIAYLALSISSYDSKELWSDLKLLRDKKVDKLIIYMNSPGGAAHQGMSIADELRIFKASKIPIIIEARGMIASAAIPVFLSGDKRIASESTVFMIHPAALFKWGQFSEELKDLQNQANMLKLMNSNYANVVSSNSKLAKEEVLELLKKTTWYTSEEAMKMGFVDEIK